MRSLASRALVSATCGVLLAASSAVGAQLPLWPWPKSVTDQGVAFVLDTANLRLTASGFSSDVLDAAFKRYTTILKSPTLYPSTAMAPLKGTARFVEDPTLRSTQQALNSLPHLTCDPPDGAVSVVDVNVVTNNMDLVMGMDESCECTRTRRSSQPCRSSTRPPPSPVQTPWK